MRSGEPGAVAAFGLEAGALEAVVVAAAVFAERGVVVEVAAPDNGAGCCFVLAVHRCTSACRGAVDILVEDARISSDCPQGR